VWQPNRKRALAGFWPARNSPALRATPHVLSQYLLPVRSMYIYKTGRRPFRMLFVGRLIKSLIGIHSEQRPSLFPRTSLLNIVLYFHSLTIRPCSLVILQDLTFRFCISTCSLDSCRVLTTRYSTLSLSSHSHMLSQLLY
jgi:hypothetical protein